MMKRLQEHRPPDQAPRVPPIGRTDALVLGLAAVFLLAFVGLTWGQWPLLTADSARELYIPFQVRHGALIYQDFYHLYGPLAPWTWATLLGLLGERLEVLYGASALHLMLISGLLYAVARQVLSALPAAAVLALFLSHFALGRDLEGYLWPYTFAATFGVALGLGTLLGLLRHLVTGRRRWLALAGLCVGLSCVTKLEFGFAAAAVALVYVGLRTWLAWWRERPWTLADLLAGVVPALLVGGGLLAWLLHQVPLSVVLESVWPQRLMALWNSRDAWRGSLVTWRFNLFWLMVDLAALALALLGGRFWAWGRQRPWRMALGLLPPLLLAGGLAARPERWQFWWEWAHRVWVSPSFLLLLAVALGACWQCRARGRWHDVTLAWLLLSLYGLLITTRTLFHGINEYTGYQAPVALIAWVALATQWGPRALGLRLSTLGQRLPLCLLLAALMGRHGLDLANTYAVRMVRVDGPAGSVWALPEHAEPFNATLRFLKASLKPGERFVAAPMEPSLYLFAGQDNPVKENQIFYGYLTTPDEELDFLARLKAARVAYFVLSNFGEERWKFGVGYMPTLGAWLAKDCRVAAEFGRGAYRIRIFATPFGQAGVPPQGGLDGGG
ncbi:MAG: glycosyltransferase family 39 protein [Candidatus Sericytochromatia bacterium]|nr:glycosyltransferase family 39 protein [Candidatus Sericytochromatia bacterium]